PAAAAARRSARRSTNRPGLEMLEDRTLLSAHLLADINQGTTTGSLPFGFVNLNGTAYFFADDGVHGNELWQSDGSAGGTSLVNDINPGSNGSVFQNATTPVVYKGALFFLASDGTHGTQLWTSNGTTNGTVPVTNLTSSFGGAPSELVVANNLLFFAGPSQT